jgi:GrpB-like predicted nucleotidyltransferase (UPF0157 family)
VFSSSRFAIELVEHDPEWARVAARETTRLREALGDALVVVHHVGSTSVPGLRAKPIVDLRGRLAEGAAGAGRVGMR